MKILRHFYNFGVMLFLLGILPTFSFSETLILYPTEDASVFQQFPSMNYSNSSLYIGYTTENEWESRIEIFLKFNVPSIPSGATINSSILSLYCWEANSAYTNGNIFSNVYKITGGAWDESSITWNNKPSFSWDENQSDDFNGTGWWRFDWNPAGSMRDFVQEWVNDPSLNYGLIMDAD